MIKRYAIIFMTFLLVALFSNSCKNPFGHRSSEPPIGLSGTWEVPTTPQVVINNLLYAYNEKNINNFSSCLTDSFRFSAYEDSIEAELRGEGWLYYDWDRRIEESIARSIFQSFSTDSDSSFMVLQIDLSSNPLDIENDTTASLVRTYTLTFEVPDADSTVTTIAVGESTFKMSRSPISGWAIDVWQDRPNKNNNFDWADFKALFR